MDLSYPSRRDAAVRTVRDVLLGDPERIDSADEVRTSSLAVVCSWNIRVSMAAERRLLAAVMAWMSPVRCRLNSSIGTTCISGGSRAELGLEILGVDASCLRSRKRDEV